MEKNKKTTKIIALAVIILLVLGVVTYFTLQRTKKNEPASTNVKTLDKSQPHVDAPGGETNIPIQDGKFIPEVMTVGTGTQVNWINEDSKKHTVVSDNKDFKSDDINPGQYFSFTFS